MRTWEINSCWLSRYQFYSALVLLIWEIPPYMNTLCNIHNLNEAISAKRNEGKYSWENRFSQQWSSFMCINFNDVEDGSGIFLLFYLWNRLLNLFSTTHKHNSYFLQSLSITFPCSCMDNISASGASHWRATPHNQTLQIRHVFLEKIALNAVFYIISMQVNKEILPLSVCTNKVYAFKC